MRRTGRLRVVLTAWLEEQIVALVDLPDEVIKQVNSPDAIRKESLRRFRHASFSLHVKNTLVVQNAIETGLFIPCCVAKSLSHGRTFYCHP